MSRPSNAPDADIQTTWHYHWELITKHLTYGSSNTGYLCTEFLDRRGRRAQAGPRPPARERGGQQRRHLRAAADATAAVEVDFGVSRRVDEVRLFVLDDDPDVLAGTADATVPGRDGTPSSVRAPRGQPKTHTWDGEWEWKFPFEKKLRGAATIVGVDVPPPSGP